MKYDSGSYAVLTEQGFCLQHCMTVGNALDVVAGPPDCAGHAADAVSGYTQVKMEDAAKLHRIPKSECPDAWIRLPLHNMAQIMVRHWSASGFPRMKCVPTPTSWSLVEKTIRRSSIWTRMGKVPNWECQFFSSKTWIVLVGVRGQDVKIAGKNQNMAPMWKKLMKNVDLEEPTSFLDHVYVGCTQRECESNENIFEEYKKCSNHKFLQEQLRNYLGGRNADISSWSYDMEGHSKKCVEDVANWPTEILTNCTKSKLQLWTTRTSRKKSWRQWENCSKCARRLS